MNIFKRLLAFTITLVLVVSSFAGCGSSGGKVTLKWSTTWYGQKDDKLVLKEVNKRLEKLLPGVQIEFVDNNSETFDRQMAAGEVFDIAWTGYTYNLETEIKNKAYLPLNDYINEKDTPNIYKEMQTYESDYASATVDGKLYALPNQQPLFSESPYIEIPAELFEYFDVDAFIKATYASPTTTREVYEVIDKYLEKIYSLDLTDTDMVTPYIDIKHLEMYLPFRGYASAASNLAYKLFDNPNNEVVVWNETPEYKLWLEYAAKWYEDGYISKDVLTGTGAGNGSRNYPISASNNGNYFNLWDEERGIREVRDTDDYVTSYQINIEPKDLSHTVQNFVTLGSEATYLAIPYTSKYPEKAIQLLDLLRSEKGTEGNELYNMLVYGFAKDSEEAETYGTYHYTLDGDLAIGNNYTIQPSTSETYGKPHWVMGNVMLAYRTPNILEGQSEYCIEYETVRYKQCKKAEVAGLRIQFDASFDVERSNITSLKASYSNVLGYGTLGKNYQATYDEYLSKLHASGIDKIKAEVERQISEYIKDNGGKND